MECPSLSNLLDCLQGQLPADERPALLAHLSSGCPGCRENQRWLEEVLQLTSEDKSFEYSEKSIQQVVFYFNAQYAKSSPSVPQFIARLIFDSFAPNQLMDVRSNLTGTLWVSGRQMLFHAAGYDIDLRFEEAEDSDDEELIGQILSEKQEPSELARLSVYLIKGEAEIDNVKTDERGIFKFARVFAGVYNLKIQVPEGEIYIFEVATAHFK
jgi:hypothetical protein